MLKRFISAFVLLSLLLCFSVSADEYHGYKVFSDPEGNIYLMAPKQFTLVRKAPSVPLQIRPKNGLLRVYDVPALAG